MLYSSLVTHVLCKVHQDLTHPQVVGQCWGVVGARVDAPHSGSGTLRIEECTPLLLSIEGVVMLFQLSAVIPSISAPVQIWQLQIAGVKQWRHGLLAALGHMHTQLYVVTGNFKHPAWWHGCYNYSAVLAGFAPVAACSSPSA
jgi:hypothetical protein